MEAPGNSLLIESNRKIAVSRVDDQFTQNSSATNLRNSFQVKKSEWTTTLDSGIEVNPGDQISLEYSAINVPGIGSEVIEFLGSTNTSDNDGIFRKDNETDAEFEFYVTNRLEFNMPAPVGDARMRRPLYSAQYGTPSLDGRFAGNGQHTSGQGTYLGEAAGFQEFCSSYPYRAIPGVAWSTYIGTEQKFSDPKIINTPALDNATWGAPGSQDKYAEHTPLARGPYTTSRPSSDRMYVGNVPDLTKNGIIVPFMDFTTSAQGGADSGDLNNITAWTPKRQVVNFKIREGNSTPARIGEVLSTQMKDRNINDSIYGAYSWTPQDIIPGAYNWSPPIGTALAAGQKRVLTFTQTGVVCGKTYQTLESSTGYLLRRGYLKNLLPATAFNKWSCEFDFESGDNGNTSFAGRGYRTAEAYRALYNNLLCGNPEEWELATGLIPRLQYLSTTTALVNTNGGFKEPQAGGTYGGFIIPTMWTGDTNQLNEDPRNGTLPNVKLGEYGNHPRILNLVSTTDRTVAALNPTGSYPAGGADGPFSWSYRAPAAMPFHDIQDYEVLITNMFLRGGADAQGDNGFVMDQLEASNEKRQKWFPFTGADAPIPENQDNNYFDAAYVDWLFGRIDDEFTFANATVDGLPGVNVFLSNDYLTNIYQADPTNPLFTGPNSILVESAAPNKGHYTVFEVKPTALSGSAPIPTVTWCSYNFEFENVPGFKELGYNNEAQQRNVKVFRFLPSPPGPTDLPITAENLYNEKCTWLVGPEFGPTFGRFRTRPPNSTFEIYKEQIFDKYIGKFNNGKGCGVIPVYDWTNGSIAIRNEPFLAVIAFKDGSKTQRAFPRPYRGESFFPASASFLQNKLAFPITTQLTNPDSYSPPNVAYDGATARTIENCIESEPYQYANSIFCGANDPIIEFNTVFTRFSISKLHTTSFRGNGPFNRMDVQGGNADADSIVVTTDSRPAAISRKDAPESKIGGVLEDKIYDPGAGVGLGGTTNVISFAQLEAVIYPYTTLSTQGGVALVSLSIPFANKTGQAVLSPWDYHNFENTLFFKLGYRLNQLLPLCGMRQTQFNSSSHNLNFGKDNNIGLQCYNQVKPVTTNAYVSSSEQPSFVIGFGAINLHQGQSTPQGITGDLISLPLPAYNLGVNYRNSATQGNSDQLIAFALPNKTTFPYLVLYSNIASPCGYQYVGSSDGKQALNKVIAFLSTNYTVSDYSFGFRSDLVFTVTKPYVITTISSSIRLPNGLPAENLLGENSAVIYRIDFARRSPPMELAPPDDKKKDKKDKKKKDDDDDY